MGHRGIHEEEPALIEEFGNELKVRVEFEPEPLYDAEAAEAFSKKCQAEKPDGVVLFPMHLSHWGWVQKAHAPDLPTVIIAPLGTTFTQQMQPLAKLPKVYLASTSDYELPALKFGLKMIRTAHDMRQSKIAVIRGNETKEQTLEPLGLTLRYMPRARFPEVLATVETTSDVVQLADELRQTARGIVEPSDDDLLNSAKNYFASRKLMKEEGCDGITMDCLGLLTVHKMPCPPCVAWSRLLDQGVPAICEADTNAVMSHTLCCMLLGKPGFPARSRPRDGEQHANRRPLHLSDAAGRLRSTPLAVRAAESFRIEYRRVGPGPLEAGTGRDGDAVRRPRQNATRPGQGADQPRNAPRRRVSHVGRNRPGRPGRHSRHEGLPSALRLWRSCAGLRRVRADVRHCDGVDLGGSADQPGTDPKTRRPPPLTPPPKTGEGDFG